VMEYRGAARAVILRLKHADATHLAPTLAQMMVGPARSMDLQNPVVVPIPLHRWRLAKRKYNQAALLAQGLARLTAWDHMPDALLRPRPTKPHENMTRSQRFYNMDGAILPHPKRSLKARDVVLVDDVMTSGATMAVAAEACYAMGATRVAIQTLARVTKDT